MTLQGQDSRKGKVKTEEDEKGENLSKKGQQKNYVRGFLRDRRSGKLERGGGKSTRKKGKRYYGWKKKKSAGKRTTS